VVEKRQRFGMTKSVSLEVLFKNKKGVFTKQKMMPL